MFYPYPNGINGHSLHPKTLCLTFDDGPGKTTGRVPGPKTHEIAEYLKSESIIATFFMVGKHAQKYPEIVEEVKKMGHLVGNHSFSHPRWDEIPLGAWIPEQLLRTDDLIGNQDKTFYRPPFVQWPIDHPNFAELFNSNDYLRQKYIGPIGFNFLFWDWDYWEKDKSTREAANSYLEQLKEKEPAGEDRGIIIMHDSSADLEHSRQNNQTYEMVQILIPELRNMGYKFERLDLVPEIQKMLLT